MEDPHSTDQQPRYTIRRRAGETRCDECEPEYNNTTYVLWLTAAQARQRGFIHCAQCGRALIPPEQPQGSAP